MKYHRLKQKYLAKKSKRDVQWFEGLRTKVFDKLGSEKALSLKAPDEYKGYSAGDIIATLDNFSFNFVLSSIEEYSNVKNYTALLMGVRLLTEMMVVLVEMSESKISEFSSMAHSLQQRIFHEGEFLERLPNLLRTWSADILPFSYAVEVVTLTHFVLKILDSGNIAGRIRVRKKKYVMRCQSLYV